MFPSSEIYDGLGAVYDYGQMGVELKNNIKQSWWQSMVLLLSLIHISIKTYRQMEDMGISLSNAIAYMPDNAGYFSWKYRVYEADVINYRCV